MPPPPPAEGLASRLFLGPALRTQPDRRLVSLVREGYETAFEEIVRRYGRALGRYAAAIVPRHRAEDVTQDAFSKALLALRRNDADIDLRPWLFRIVRNTALNELRDQPPPSQELFEASGATGSALEATLAHEEVADLLRRLRALPDPQRAAIVMRELEGLSHEEIAAALGITGGAARQAIHRARQKLRDGVGLLIPMPILKLLLGGAAGVPAGVAGASAGGAAAGGGGAAIGLKAAGALLLVAGTVGTGVALKERTHVARDRTPTLRVDDRPPRQAGSTALPGPTAALASDDAVVDASGEHRGGPRRGGGAGGEDRGSGGGNSGPGDGALSNGDLSGGGSGDDGGGRSSGGDASHSGDGSGSSGPGPGGSGDGSGTSGSGSAGSSGPGPSGGGDSVSGSSGPGPSGSGGDGLLELPGGDGSGSSGPGPDSSGFGDGSSGSGTSGSDDLSGGSGPG